MTEWKWRLFLFVPIAANTLENREAVAGIFVDNGSGESRTSEEGAFTGAARLSFTGDAPADAFAINTAVKGAMRDGLKALIESIAGARWYVIAAIDLPMWDKGELIQSNREAVDDQIGEQFTFTDALTGLGLQRIEPEA